MKVLCDRLIEESVFDKPVENCDYPIYRIPSIVSAKNGDLHIAYECRQGSDWSVIDIGYKKSTDGGRTWTDRKVLADGKGRNACNNPCFIVDGNTIHFLYCENYKRMFHKYSNDYGENWSQANEITEIFDSYYWSCVAVGPGHGLSAHGKLIAPVWLAMNQKDMFSHHPSEIAVIISDDCGQSWHCASVNKGDLIDPSESCVALLANGNLLLNIRNENKERCRAIAFSHDAVEWSEPHFVPFLPDPVCCGGMCNEPNGILFVNCCSQKHRENLTLYALTDFLEVIEKLRIRELGGYSDITYNKKSGTAFVLYETNECRQMRIAEIDIS